MPNPKGPPSRPQSLRLPNSWWDALTRLAHRRGQTRVAVVKLAIEEHLRAAGVFPDPED